MKKSFKDRITDLGLSYTKELLILFAINLVLMGASIAIFFITHMIAATIVGGIILITADYLYLSRYSSMEKQKEKDHVEELISLLSYFEIFVSNGNNVYTSFRMLIPYCSPFMDDCINSLLNQIDSDKSVGPYINFAARFSNRIIESLMLSIYQMVDNGEASEQFKEFDVLFSSVSKEYKSGIIDEKKRGLDSLNVFPLVGAGAITIILAISIIGVIGEYINVI